MRALARAAAWGALIRSIIAAGFSTPHDVCYCAFGIEPFEDALLRPAIDTLSAVGTDAPPGCILALGIGQRGDYELVIVDLLRKSESGSATEKACVLALSLLATEHDETAELVAERTRSVKLDSEFSRVALLNNRSSSSCHLLNKLISETWDTRVALNLLNRGNAGDDIGTRIAERLLVLLTTRNPNSYSDINQIYNAIKDTQHVSTVLNHNLVASLHDAAFAFEGSFWVVGSKVNIIMLLSLADNSAAYSAAVLALKDSRVHDRAQYPNLLFKIDSEKAKTDLLLLLQQEKDEEVKAAIGRVLGEISSSDVLSDWLSDDSPSARQAACAVAGHLSAEDSVISQVISLLDDPDAGVSTAAADALLRIRRTQRRDQLVRSLSSEMHRDEKWPLIDLAIAVADAGDESSGYPDQLVAASKNLDWPMRNYIKESLQEQQKEQGKRLRSASRKK
jgi:HEAT repeat protein